MKVKKVIIDDTILHVMIAQKLIYDRKSGMIVIKCLHSFHTEIISLQFRSTLRSFQFCSFVFCKSGVSKTF